MTVNDESVTKLHAYNDIRSFLTQETNEKLIDELGIRDGIDRRISGLNCEYEFSLIAYFSEKIEYILGFDESFSKLTNAKTPDFLLKTGDGRKFFIEVKSKDALEFNEITQNSLNKRKQIADDLNATWCIALKMKGVWGLFDYDTFVKWNRKILYPTALNESIFMKLFGFDYYFVNKQVFAESIYSDKNNTDINCIKHEKYGRLIDYKLKAGPINLIEGLSKDSSIFVEILHDRFEDQSIENLSDGTTKVIEKLKAPILVSTNQCMMSSILRTINKYGLINDAKTFFNDFINHKNTESQINAYRVFWNMMIERCENHEIFKMPDFSFNEDWTLNIDIE